MNQEEIDVYINGKCMYLAAALHRQFGWEIQVAQEFPDTDESYIGHAWCVDPQTGFCVDIDGAYPHDISGWIHPAAKLLTGMDEAALRTLTMTTGEYPFDEAHWEAEVAAAQAVVTNYLAPLLASKKELALA